MGRMNMLYSPIYLARIELSGTRCLLYIKMLPRAQKEIIPSQKHFCDNSWSLGASRDKPISSPFLIGGSGDVCKHCPGIAQLTPSSFAVDGVNFSSLCFGNVPNSLHLVLEKLCSEICQNGLSGGH